MINNSEKTPVSTFKDIPAEEYYINSFDNQKLNRVRKAE